MHMVDKHKIVHLPSFAPIYSIQFPLHARPFIIASNVGFDSGVLKVIRSHRSAIAVLPGLSSGLTILYAVLHGFTKELGCLLIQGMSHECLGRG